MSWWAREQLAARRHTAVGRREAAAAQIVRPPQPQPAGTRPMPTSRNIYRTADVWQREVWDFYDALGEFRQGINWKANMMSRVRLRAAKVDPLQDEPEIVDSGPAHDIVRELSGGVGGQAQLQRSFAIHLGVPGECWLVGETLPDGTNKWYTRAIEEVRPSATNEQLMAVAEGAGRWRDLPNDSYVVRIYRPHERWNGVADSPARAARPLLRELELVNRHIQAQYLSRLASAGVIIFPEEITFPVRPEFEDAPDPFVAEWIEIAAEAVRTPGTAASLIPIPVRVPADYVDKVKRIDFTLQLDANIIQKRDSALSRLAIELDMPPEALLGTKDVNHWNAWLIDEQGVKIHVAPDVEIVCDGLTTGYLHPLMKAKGLDPTGWVVWYDASELILRPDRSTSAKDAYDRFELSGTALRRELGFDESDLPTNEELREIILKKIAQQQVNAFAAMDELGFETTHDTDPNEARPNTPPLPENEDPRGNRTPPQDQPDSENPIKRTSRVQQQLAYQAGLEHAVRLDHIEDTWTLLHPLVCNDHLFSCPVTHATWKPAMVALPGQSGTYRVWLNQHGQPILGDRITDGTADDFISTRARPLPTVKL